MKTRSLLCTLPAADQQLILNLCGEHPYYKAVELVARPRTEGGLAIQTSTSAVRRFYISWNPEVEQLETIQQFAESCQILQEQNRDAFPPPLPPSSRLRSSVRSAPDAPSPTSKKKSASFPSSNAAPSPPKNGASATPPSLSAASVVKPKPSPTPSASLRPRTCLTVPRPMSRPKTPTPLARMLPPNRSKTSKTTKSKLKNRSCPNFTSEGGGGSDLSLSDFGFDCDPDATLAPFAGSGRNLFEAAPPESFADVDPETKRSLRASIPFLLQQDHALLRARGCDPDYLAAILSHLDRES